MASFQTEWEKPNVVGKILADKMKVLTPDPVALAGINIEGDFKGTSVPKNVNTTGSKGTSLV